MKTKTEKLTLEGLKSEIKQLEIEDVELFVGVNKEGNLISFSFDLLRMTEQKYISVSANEYEQLITEEKGREDAKERLSDPEYWADLGYLNTKDHNPLFNYIDFDRAAEDIIKIDGWENVNGEFQEFGTIEGITYYMALAAFGQHEFKSSDIEKWLVDKKQTKTVLRIWANFHLKSDLFKYTEQEFLIVLKYLIDYVKQHKHFIDRSLVLAHSIETIKELQGCDEI